MRRRGAVLENAIREAVFAELLETGFGALSMEAVSVRAGTGKAPLYRRWSSKRDMVLDAIEQALPEAAEVQKGGELRTELIDLLRAMVTTLASVPGRAITTLLSERHHDPDLADAVVARLITPRQARLAQVIDAAIARDEISPPRRLEILTKVGPAMVLQHELEHGVLPDDGDIVDFVDLVLIPALRAAPAG